MTDYSQGTQKKTYNRNFFAGVIPLRVSRCFTRLFPEAVPIWGEADGPQK